LLPSSGKNSRLVEPLDKMFNITGHHGLVNVLIHALESRYFSKAVTGKRFLKNKI
jgi:hypothetical protein